MKNLWDDPDFIEKRINEQLDYLYTLRNKWINDEISDTRFNELHESALEQFYRFNDRLDELNKQNNDEKSSEEKEG